MGQKPEILLVTLSRRIAAARLLAVGVMTATTAAADTIVRAADYDAYWLWAGVRARPELATAKTIYLLQAEIGPDDLGETRLKAQGATEPGSHPQALWLVYRVRSIDWTPAIFAAVKRRLAEWRAKSDKVIGVQIDFDAATRGLTTYAAFLAELRQTLPPDCALSISGLMDWASQATPEDIDRLGRSVDEVVFQTYRGRATVDHIDDYLARVGRVHTPFRLGLAEGAVWSPPEMLARHPYFRGYVVFLQNPPR
ncbi:DUF3142 domain-containing protein [Methylocystis sp. 9N]|uniref:DUF3142 domain-containing protein n=1 Tax=Methylocystis borbori TaxID=3118750 RepID=A0ABU7XFE3_9HYPH